ncbi:UNVERIFIED_CONTAM: taf5 [Trichonephila clavipes]
MSSLGFEPSPYGTACVKFHPNSKYLATASARKVIQLWTLDDLHAVRCFIGHDFFINSIAFAPDGQQMASADDGGNIIIWDLGSGQILKTILAHSSRIFSISYNKNSSSIASGGFDPFLRVWDVNFTPIKKESYSPIRRKRKEAQMEGQIDSYALNSVLHYVSFCKNNTLISVGTSIR